VPSPEECHSILGQRLSQNETEPSHGVIADQELRSCSGNDERLGPPRGCLIAVRTFPENKRAFTVPPFEAEQ